MPDSMTKRAGLRYSRSDSQPAISAVLSQDIAPVSTFGASYFFQGGRL